MTTELAAIVAKIHKLLSLTEGRGATEAEAALAASHVQRLLAEHNLTMATVEAAGGNAGSAGERKRGSINRKQVYRWQRELMETLARLNYCHLTLMWKYTGSTSRAFDGYELIGRASNVATVEHLFDYLLEAIERLARNAVDDDPARFFTRFAHSFKEGCSDRLIERLRLRDEELKAEARRKADEAAQNGGGRALITLDDVAQTEADLNTDYRHGRPPGTTAQLRAEERAASAARQAERDRIRDQHVANGVPYNVADYMSWGYSRERAEALCDPKPEKPETEAQRRKREQREHREWERWSARQRRAAQRLDQAGYRQGKAAGDKVGLDPQVSRRADQDRLR